MTSSIQILSAKWVIPIEPRATVYEDFSVVIDAGKIVELLPTFDAAAKYPTAARKDYATHALMPGLINSHTHAAMSLLRGYADDLPLMHWLNNHIWPAEAQWVSADFIRDGSELAIAEMLLSGTTCFSDMYFFPNITAVCAQDNGIRAMVGAPIFDFPSAWGSGPDEYFEKGLKVHDTVRSFSRVNACLAPHAPFTVSDEPLKQARTWADELQLPLHMHVHESAGEITQSVSDYGVRPIQRLDDLGLLNPRMMAVHMTQLLDDEIELIANQGVHVVHCPASNAKLASGRCPTEKLLAANVNVCLGTDGAASNNNLDMFSEMRLAALSAKQGSADATALNAFQVLEMATINAAKALNWQDEIGSLESGKAADLIAIDLNHLSTQPVYDPAAQLIYAASKQQVSDVWVNGKQQVAKGALINMDSDAILQRASNWQQKIAHTHNTTQDL